MPRPSNVDVVECAERLVKEAIKQLQNHKFVHLRNVTTGNESVYLVKQNCLQLIEHWQKCTVQNTSTNWCMWCQTIRFLYAIDSDTMIRQAIIHWWPAGPSLIPCNSSERCSDVFRRPLGLYGMHQESILQLRRGHCKEDPSNSRGENEGLVSARMHGGASFARIHVFSNYLALQ